MTAKHHDPGSARSELAGVADVLAGAAMVMVGELNALTGGVWLVQQAAVLAARGAGRPGAAPGAPAVTLQAVPERELDLLGTLLSDMVERMRTQGHAHAAEALMPLRDEVARELARRVTVRH